MPAGTPAPSTATEPRQRASTIFEKQHGPLLLQAEAAVPAVRPVCRAASILKEAWWL